MAWPGSARNFRAGGLEDLGTQDPRIALPWLNGTPAHRGAIPVGEDAGSRHAAVEPVFQQGLAGGRLRRRKVSPGQGEEPAPAT